MIDAPADLRPTTYVWRYAPWGPLWRLWTNGTRFIARCEEP
jgi:hypothetical protein